MSDCGLRPYPTYDIRATLARNLRENRMDIDVREWAVKFRHISNACDSSQCWASLSPTYPMNTMFHEIHPRMVSWRHLFLHGQFG